MRAFALLAASALALLDLTGTASALTVSEDYYEDSRNDNCSPGLTCTIAFPLAAASAGKFLHLETIDCFGQNPQGFVSMGQYFLTDNGLNVRRAHGLSIERTTGPGLFSFNQTVDFKVTGGPPRVLNVSLSSNSSGTSWSFSCSITGRLTSQ